MNPASLRLRFGSLVLAVLIAARHAGAHQWPLPFDKFFPAPPTVHPGPEAATLHIRLVDAVSGRPTSGAVAREPTVTLVFGFSENRDEHSFDTLHDRVGLLICYDRQVPETSRVLAVRGAGMILIPAQSPSVSQMNADLMMPLRAYPNNVFITLVNPLNLLATNPDGERSARNPDRNAEGILDTEVDLARRTPVNWRRPEIYQGLITPR